MDPPPPSEELSVDSPEAAPLPLPVRGTRYAVGAILVAVILTVVATTYLRIEQQLQRTLEQRLTSVLGEQVHSTEHWLDARRKLTRRIADLPRLRKQTSDLATKGDPSARKELEASLYPLLETHLASHVVLYAPGGSPLLTLAPSKNAPPPLEKFRANEGAKLTQVVIFEGARFIATLAPIFESKQPVGALALFTPIIDLTSGLHSEAGAETYAFDALGRLDSTPTRSSRDGFPPSFLTQPEGSGSKDSTKVEQYVGKNENAVVGAWHWIDDAGFGLASEIASKEAHSSISLLRQSFLVLVTLVGAAVLGFLALGRWTLRVREESLLMTRRLGRLARAIQPLSAALEHDPSAVLLVDNEGVVVYANAASHRVLRVASPLLGLDVDAVFENLHGELQAALASGQDSIVAQGSESKEDETLLVSSRALHIDGNPHFLYMLRPVTQQVRRQEVEHWKKLIRVMSHELNNALAPITSLLSSARTVNQMTHQDPRLGQIFESIQERASHLVSFLEGYREVARLPRPARRDISWESFLQGLESQKKFRRCGTVPTASAFFDPIQMERVLVNVLNNSYEAGSSPEDVEVEVTEEVNGFRINIQDRGSGMPEPVLKQAMLPFFSTKRTGTGVGLALSREIIEAHGGQLTLANREGGGLVVSCFVPLAPSPASRGSHSMPVAPRVTSSDRPPSA